MFTLVVAGVTIALGLAALAVMRLRHVRNVFNNITRSDEVTEAKILHFPKGGEQE
jgi:hypothetical protein